MNTFTKFTSIFFLAITMLLNIPSAKADSGTGTKVMAIHMLGARHANIGSTVAAQLDTYFSGKGILTVENAQGKRFVETPIQIRYGKNLVKLNVSDIPSGVYFIKVNVDGNIETTSFVVSH